MPANPRPLPSNLPAALIHPWTWRMAWRDSRSQRARLLIFSLAIVSGIAALVAIHSLKASVERGIEAQAKELLGSDLQISSNQRISDEDASKLSGMATRTSRESSFPSMMTFPNGSARLVLVRGLEGEFPFYGKIETDPAAAWKSLAGEPGVILDPALLEQFQAKLGDEITLGKLRLKILGVVRKAAPSSNRFSAIAPEAYVRISDISGSGLTGPNSIVNHLLHLEISQSPPADELKANLRRDFPAAISWRLETIEDRKETLGDALDSFQRYLGILALASLALGAIGVAGAVQSHITRRISAIAVLQCLGAPRQLAAAIYIAQSAVLGLLGAILGAAIGISLQMVVITVFQDSLPITLTPAPEWAAVLRTTLAGFGVCCGFALIPLLKISRIPPGAALRGGALLPGGLYRAIPVYLCLVALLLVLAYNNDPNWNRAFMLVGGLAVAFGLVLGVAKGLMAITRRVVKPTWPYLLRQGISNIHRPGNQTLLFLLSLGLGTFLLLTIVSAGQMLQQRLHLTESAQTPNMYLIDVQPDQIDGVTALLKEHQLPVLESAPMVTMRVLAIGGVPVTKAKDVPRWIARREFRSSYRGHLTSSEKIIAGEWQQTVTDPAGPIPLSLETRIAGDMRVGLGDKITLDVQGLPLEAYVASIREVDWSRFNLNFFMVFPPGVLEAAPGYQVITTRIPDAAASGNLQQALTANFANVSSIDLTQVLGTVRNILSKISLVVTILGGFTLIAAIPILAGTLMNGRDVRLRESVLLRTLGASAKQIRIILTVEYAALGCLAALTGILLAVGASAALAIFVFKVPLGLDVLLLGGAFLVTILLSIIGGWVLSRGASTQPPLDVLRSI